MWRMHVGDFEIELRKIHDQYGPLVRIAPDEVSSGVPAEIPAIYRMQKPLEKTVWYLPWRAMPQFHERPDMFTTLPGKDHAAYKKIIAGAFTMGSVLRNEDLMDECLRLFMNRMEEFADREKSFDFGLWLEMYVITSILSKQHKPNMTKVCVRHDWRCLLWETIRFLGESSRSWKIHRVCSLG